MPYLIMRASLITMQLIVKLQCFQRNLGFFFFFLVNITTTAFVYLIFDEQSIYTFSYC